MIAAPKSSSIAQGMSCGNSLKLWSVLKKADFRSEKWFETSLMRPLIWRRLLARINPCLFKHSQNRFFQHPQSHLKKTSLAADIVGTGMLRRDGCDVQAVGVGVTACCGKGRAGWRVL